MPRERTNTGGEQGFLRFGEIKITPEEIFKEDAFEREQLIDMLTNGLRKTRTPCVLGLNGEWGSGKTSFLKMWKAKLEKTEQGCKCVYYDAWQADFTKNAFSSLFCTAESNMKRNG